MAVALALGVDLTEEQNCEICTLPIFDNPNEPGSMQVYGCLHVYHGECLGQYSAMPDADIDACPACGFCEEDFNELKLFTQEEQIEYLKELRAKAPKPCPDRIASSPAAAELDPRSSETADTASLIQRELAATQLAEAETEAEPDSKAAGDAESVASSKHEASAYM